MSVWTTAYGKEIEIEEMDDEHLTNSIQMMRRRYKEAFFNKSAAAAAIWRKQWLLSEIDTNMRRQFASFGLLLDEAKRRGMHV